MGALEDLERSIAEATKAKKIKDKQEAFVAAKAAEIPAFSLRPVSQFYDHVLKEPREILEARYVRDICNGDESQLILEARHQHLATLVAYHFQVKYYQEQTGAVPTNVVKRYNGLMFAYPHGLFGRAYDEDDPKDVEIWDDSYVVAIKSNPWQKNISQKAFFCVEMGGETGTQFAPLCELIQRMCEITVDAAQERALDFFTKSVREGLTKIRIV